MLSAAVLLVAILSGATATVAGFGIGSLLTPIIALRVGTPVAVAAVALPHLSATALRLWRLRRDVDAHLLRHFGLLSAAGSVAGAGIATRIDVRSATMVLGGLLVLTGTMALAGGGTAWRIPRPAAWLLGALSGLFGGLAGNQGGMRAIALMQFRLPPRGFVATATATALLVDLARTPIYLSHAGSTLYSHGLLILLATGGVLIGTLIGERILLGLAPERFRRLVGGIVLAVGVVVLARAG
jgi:uncharacterized membrane protein YfcA